MLRNLLKSNYGYSRRYYGPLKAAIMDWSGTTADKYVIAPAVVFCKVFEKQGVPITMKESRLPMGLRKDIHIKKITEIPEVISRWKAVHNRPPNDTDIKNMFTDFVPLQLECIAKYSKLIPGTAETVDKLRSDYNLKIGSTTGFTSSVVNVLLEEASKQGYVPDSSVAGDEVENGERPKPFMIYQNLEKLNIHPIQSVLKVDDTVGGIGEGLEAGCWTVGLAKYSNYMDIDSLEHEKSLTPEDMEYKLEVSRDVLRKSGAHYVVDDITDLPEVVESINARLNTGEKP